MTITRRTFLAGSAAGLAGATLAGGVKMSGAFSAAPTGRILLGAREGAFRSSSPRDLAVAGRCGLDGVELGVRSVPNPQQKNAPSGTLNTETIGDAAARQQFKDQAKAAGLVVSSLSMDLMNQFPLVSEPEAFGWLLKTIEASQDFGAGFILVPFFGKADLLENKELKKANVDTMVARIKEAAPKAKAAGVVLGLENTLSARQNLEILDRIGSDAVQCYYDIGNSTRNGYDVPAEIRQLKGHLAAIHFKDGANFLGEGDVKMEPVAEVVRAIDYRGWIVLETSCPTKNGEADCKRNAEYVRKLLKLPRASG
jgi:L-ribulose-5-phosphate 3-epimerase